MLAVAPARFLEQPLVVGIQFLSHDGVGALENLQLLWRHLANNANGQARAWERLPIHHGLRQAQRHPQRTHFVFEKVVERLDEFKANTFGKGDKIVVALYGGGLAARLARSALYDVGVDGALRQVLHAVQLGGLLKEHLPKLGANERALLLGISYARKHPCIALLRLHMHQRHIKPMAKDLLHQFWLALAQHAMIHEDAGEPIAHGTMHKCRHHA